MLASESGDLITFASHRGIFCYTRLIFGMSSSADLYQKEIEIALAGLPDDIVIGCRDDIYYNEWRKHFFNFARKT